MNRVLVFLRKYMNLVSIIIALPFITAFPVTSPADINLSKRFFNMKHWWDGLRTSKSISPDSQEEVADGHTEKKTSCELRLIYFDGDCHGIAAS